MGDAKARAGVVKIQTAVAQIKPRKGDYECNLRRVGDLFAQLEEDGPDTDVLVLPETVLSGYFLEGGVRDVARTREQLFDDLLRVYRARVTRPEAMLDICLGFYELGDGKYYNSALYATLTAEGSSYTLHPAPYTLPGIGHVHRKFFLPTYGVFDEKRFVSRGRSINAFPTRFGTVAVLICEDVWHSITATIAALKGAQVIYIISASPGREFTGQHLGNVARWNVLLPGIADEHNVWVVYSGLVGFEGGKGFTGSSQVIDPFGNTKVQGSVIDECLVRATIDLEDVAIARAVSPLLADLEAALGDVTMELEQIARKPHLE
jgi:predicted amidohydrolase